MKKTLLTLLAGLTLAGCSTINPKGHIDITYVPQRNDSIQREHEIKTEIEAGLETRLGTTNFNVGGRSRSYMPIKDFDGRFQEVNKQEYDLFARITKDNWEAYLNIMCSHPLRTEEYWLWDENINDYRYMNYGSLTELGVKFKW